MSYWWWGKELSDIAVTNILQWLSLEEEDENLDDEEGNDKGNNEENDEDKEEDDEDDEGAHCQIRSDHLCSDHESDGDDDFYALDPPPTPLVPSAPIQRTPTATVTTTDIHATSNTDAMGGL